MSLRINPIQALLQSKNEIFTICDLRILWGTTSPKQLKNKIRYFTKTNQLLRLKRGIFALNNNFNQLELAQKLQTPSYISLETVLRKKGIIQQYSEEITCIGTYPRSYTIKNILYHYHKMDKKLLSSPLGIEKKTTYTIASPERALVDSLYLGFKADVERYTKWDISLLKNLEREFSTPRVTEGLQSYNIFL